MLFWIITKSRKSSVELKGETLKYIKYNYACFCVGTTMRFSYNREEVIECWGRGGGNCRFILNKFFICTK